MENFEHRCLDLNMRNESFVDENKITIEKQTPHDFWCLRIVQKPPLKLAPLIIDYCPFCGSDLMTE